MKCPKCGRTLPDDLIFCGYCGVRIDELQENEPEAVTVDLSEETVQTDVKETDTDTLAGIAEDDAVGKAPSEEKEDSDMDDDIIDVEVVEEDLAEEELADADEEGDSEEEEDFDGDDDDSEEEEESDEDDDDSEEEEESDEDDDDSEEEEESDEDDDDSEEEEESDEDDDDSEEEEESDEDDDSEEEEESDGDDDDSEEEEESDEDDDDSEEEEESDEDDDSEEEEESDEDDDDSEEEEESDEDDDDSEEEEESDEDDDETIPGSDDMQDDTFAEAKHARAGVGFRKKRRKRVSLIEDDEDYDEEEDDDIDDELTPEEAAEFDRKEHRLGMIIRVEVAIIAVVVIGIIAVLIKSRMTSSDAAETAANTPAAAESTAEAANNAEAVTGVEGQNAQIPAETPAPTETPVTAEQVSIVDDYPADIDNYTVADFYYSDATSYLNENTAPDAMIDSDNTTSWQDNNINDESGVGDQLVFGFDGPKKVKYLLLRLGNWAEDEEGNSYYTQDNRPSQMTLIANGQTYPLSFSDVQTSHFVVFAEPIETSEITLTIDGIYQGTTTNDCCVSEVVALTAE